jgi:predicted DsbA family dithiol-disulfide isomerase
MDHNREAQITTAAPAVSAGIRPPVIEVVSDIVCPWCFIGKRRVEKAQAIMDRPDVAVRWKLFQLNPTTPKEGMDRQAYRIRKVGSLAYSQQREARVAAAGAEDGIEFECFFHQRGRDWSPCGVS